MREIDYFILLLSIKNATGNVIKFYGWTVSAAYFKF